MSGVKGRSGGRNRLSIEEHLRKGTYVPSRHGPIPEGITDPRIEKKKLRRAKICAQCGGSFEQQPGKPRRCCSPACALARHTAGGLRVKQRWEKVNTSVCFGCGITFVKRCNHGNIGKFHSRECAFALRRRNRLIRQERLGVEAEARKEARKSRQCVSCGVSFQSESPTQRLCSKACRRKAEHRKLLAVTTTTEALDVLIGVWTTLRERDDVIEFRRLRVHLPL